MPETTDDPNRWFVFTLEDTDPTGVEIPKLTKLLNDLSSSFYAIARQKKGAAGPRPGRRALAEELLAGFRLIRVTPGSLTIELAPPPSQEQLQLFEDEPIPDDVVIDFYKELQEIEAGSPPTPGRVGIRRSVRTVIQDAGEFGPRVEVQFKPRVDRPDFPSTTRLRRTFRTTELSEPDLPAHAIRHRTLSGHVYMVDVELGRQRVRVKLPDGRDLTVDVTQEALYKVREALDRPVEVDIEEETEGEIPVRRTVFDLTILPSSGPGRDQPPRSIQDLQQEQQLPSETPDYIALASAIWRTDSELAEFLEHLGEIRNVEA